MCTRCAISKCTVAGYERMKFDEKRRLDFHQEEVTTALVNLMTTLEGEWPSAFHNRVIICQNHLTFDWHKIKIRKYINNQFKKG